MLEATHRQRLILDFIRKFSERNEMPPTRADIAMHFGIERASVQQHLQQMAKKGLLELSAGVTRGIRLLEGAPSVDPYSLPLLGRIAAGQPLLSDTHIQEQIRIDPEMFRPTASFLFRVQGHSMQDAHILDGDLVGIHEQAVADDRQIVAVAVEDSHTSELRLTLKRFRRRGTTITLTSENSDQERYPPIVIDARRQQIAIVGLFAGLVRRPT
jgi:repressor LexA